MWIDEQDFVIFLSSFPPFLKYQNLECFHLRRVDCINKLSTKMKNYYLNFQRFPIFFLLNFSYFLIRIKIKRICYNKLYNGNVNLKVPQSMINGMKKLFSNIIYIKICQEYKKLKIT